MNASILARSKHTLSLQLLNSAAAAAAELVEAGEGGWTDAADAGREGDEE